MNFPVSQLCCDPLKGNTMMLPKSAICQVVLVFLLAGVGVVYGGKVLAVFPAPSISHQFVYRQLMLKLQERGHNLTIVTPDPIRNSTLERYRQVDVSYVYDYWNKNFDFAADKNKLLRLVPELFMLVMVGALNDLCNIYLSDPNVAVLQDEKFDLLIVEWGILPCVYPFYLNTNKNLMGILSLTMGSQSHLAIGSTSNFAYTPELFFPYTDHMTFPQRLRNGLFHFCVYFYRIIVLWDQTNVARKYFGENIPSVFDIEGEVSLVLTNTHPTIFYPRPMAQNVIPIGGPPFHLEGRTPQKLPKDLQEFLDSGKDVGVVYFSLGSNVKSSTMPESKRAMFLNAFRKINLKVLWKWETDDLPGKPDNVKLQKWLPQTDVLAHPSVKVFMTQGGLQSMGEATHFEKPMVVIPFFADQELNAKKLESVGVAVRIDFETMTEEDIVRAINDVAGNPKYKEAMTKYSALTRDQPESPMERAVWWTEYVLRHQGAHHLRSAAVDLPWYQYFLLDVLAFILAITLTTLFLIVYIVRTLCRLVFGKKKTKKE